MDKNLRNQRFEQKLWKTLVDANVCQTMTCFCWVVDGFERPFLKSLFFFFFKDGHYWHSNTVHSQLGGISFLICVDVCMCVHACASLLMSKRGKRVSKEMARDSEGGIRKSNELGASWEIQTIIDFLCLLEKWCPRIQFRVVGKLLNYEVFQKIQQGLLSYPRKQHHSLNFTAFIPKGKS